MAERAAPVEIDVRDLGTLAHRARSSASRPVVLIDGRSGAGKTSLARLLTPLLDAQLVSLDDVYPGWDGLEAGAAAVPGMLRADDPVWRGWDWAADRAGAQHPIDPRRPLVVEGCGAISRASAPLASLRIWIDLGTGERKRRALARDGETYAPHWDRWAAHEDEHIARQRPRQLADVIAQG